MIKKMHPAKKLILTIFTIGIYEVYWSIKADRELRSEEDLQWTSGFTALFIVLMILTAGVFLVIYAIYRVMRTQCTLFAERSDGLVWIWMVGMSLIFILLRPVTLWVAQKYANERK